MRWQNSIPVTPGETITFQFASAQALQANGSNEGARLMWYGGRSFPNNAGDAIPEGQITITGQNTTWTVPAGVTVLHACAQQKGGAVNFNQAANPVALVVAGTTVLRAQNGARIGDGGGDGGLGGTAGPNRGGGGGGGYTGDGGKGGDSSAPAADSTYTGYTGSPGTGGGGTGGSGGSRVKDPGPVFGGTQTYIDYPSEAGGNVGISGRSASGSYSDPIDGDIGGGQGGNPAYQGGALAWKNAIAVTPGQVITVNAAGGRIRIIYGGAGRSYPNNAGKV